MNPHDIDTSDGRLRVDHPPRMPGENKFAAYTYQTTYDRLLNALWREHPDEFIRKYETGSAFSNSPADSSTAGE